ncbi:hypothetical protein [Nocardiopsis ganjiahuensis]|uniref:hypothetical protein n=1 Tax=Nocardiopsis ganjiahuensis TaxID=239984 RepID=UPI00034926A0|nr:hypothetical protein [Nocardiopsis ganjiahuensis]
MGISDARERKAAALAAERERLARVRSEREQGRRDSIWQEFRVSSELIADLKDAVEAAILAVGPSGGETAGKLSVLLDGKLCPEAPRVLLELLGKLPPDIGVLHLARLHEIGVPQVAESGHAAALISGRVEPTEQALRKLQDFSPELDLWRDAELLRLGAKPKSPERFLAHAPLVLIDDFLDGDPSVSLTGGERTDGGENLYLLARRDPAKLTDEQLEAIGWQDELWRRRVATDPCQRVPAEAPESAQILQRVADGDPLALKLLVGLLQGKPKQLVQHVLANPDRPAGWPRAMFAERALWPVLAELCRGTDLPGNGQGPLADFVAWRDLRAAHRDLMNVSATAYGMLAPHLESAAVWAREEATAMEVYLDLRFADPGDSQPLHDALRRLSALDSEHPVIRGNIVWVRRHLETDRNNRGPLFNPFLELGVPHGASSEEWKEAWRGLRRELRGRTEELSDVNRAHDLLRDIEARSDLESNPLYVLPVHEEELFPSPRVPSLTIPPACPLDRRTEPLNPQERAPLREAATASVMRMAVRERTP